MANLGSIDAKARAYLSQGKGKEKVKNYVRLCLFGIEMPPNGPRPPQEAAKKFIEVLERSIDGAGISESVKERIKHFGFGTPEEHTDGTYSITVFFDADLSRPSLNGTDTLRDLAELFNYGVDHVMSPQVWGYWHGELVGSRTVIPGAYFIEDAVQDFLRSYAKEYNVKSLTIRK